MSEVIDIDNFKRAWRWIKSNPNKQYKNYFRESYSNYSLIEGFVLRDIIKKIVSGTYKPSHACKIFIPKASGVLRPYTLLTVEDQIVYQSMVNVVAEHLLPHVVLNYNHSTFGNLYAGKRCMWFYRKWSEGYKNFNSEAEKAFNLGLTYSASFDLTACYDSLDHNVLRHFLRDIKCDDAFIDLLMACLREWTGTDEESKIYHNHGIPQGPLSSGLLSEVVLRYFDKKYNGHSQMRYMRYVDDIRLFASSEKDLRKMLIYLDRISKNIGLFPQSSKIEIHKVKNINEELKSVSNPTEASISRFSVSQVLIQKRLKELTERGKISNLTRFKFILAHAHPSAKINDRIWNVFKKQISNYDCIFGYFQKYKKLPKKISKYITDEIKDEPVYTTITSTMIDTLRGRLRGAEEIEFKKIAKSLWKPITLSSEIMLHSSLIRVLIENGLLKPRQLIYALKAKEWYTRNCGVRALEGSSVGNNMLEIILNEMIKDKVGDIACSAALVIINRNIPLNRPISPSVNNRALAILREVGLIKRMPNGVRSCIINEHFNSWLDDSINGIDWKIIFKNNYNKAQKFAFNCRLKAGTDTTAWVNTMDVFNDLLLNELSRHDPSIGGHTLGNFKIIYKNPVLVSKYPNIYTMVKSIHEKRLESNLSHSYTKATGKITGPIKYWYYTHKGKPLIKKAFKELANNWS